MPLRNFRAIDFAYLSVPEGVRAAEAEPTGGSKRASKSRKSEPEPVQSEGDPGDLVLP